MSKVSKDTDAQLATAREVADSYRDALQALATEPPDASNEKGKKFQRQMEISRERMRKYQKVYSALARQ